MLIVGSKNDEGHLIHVISGPETEFYMDIHGSQVMDITPLLLAMNGTPRICLSMTRCKSEVATSQIMTGSEIQHLNSFVKSDTPAASPATPTTGSSKIDELLKQPAPAAKKTTTGKCSYCGKDNSELLAVPGFSICTACAQIELGRRAPIVLPLGV